MRQVWLEHLAAPGGGPGFDLDVFRGADDEIVEAFLVTQDSREPYPVIAGVGVVPPSLREHLRDYGSVYRRTPIRDPRMVRFVIGRAGTGFDRVPFDKVVAHYRDLAVDPPEGYNTVPHEGDEALDRVLTAVVDGEGATFALDLGCGVGRSSFVVRGHAPHVLGVDFSLALVRRARNISVTVEDFFLPGPRVEGQKPVEIRLDLDGLVRDGVDFVAACATGVPLKDDAVDLVVVHSADARGPWSDLAAVRDEVRRVLAPGGVLVWHESLEFAIEPASSHAPFHGARIP